MTERRGITRYAEGEERGPDPEPGFFEGRLLRGGPRVPMMIYLPCPIDPEFGYPTDRPRHLRGWCLGQEIDVYQIWTYAKRISKARFDQLVENATRDPRRVVDLAKEPSIF